MSNSLYPKIRIALGLIILLFLVVLLITSQFFWKVLYPIPYRDIIWENALEAGIDPYFVASVIRTESNFIPSALSKSGAVGLMQLMPNTATWISNQLDIDINDEMLYDPKINIKLGTYYLKHLLNKYNNNLALSLAAYNSGMGRVKEWVSEGVWDGSKETYKNIPFDETRSFVKKVLRSYEIYSSLYGR